MTRSLSEIVALCGIEREEIALWIERRWILPLSANGDYVFNEADIARTRMIAELRRDLAVDDEAMSLVLGLMDQLYAARRRLRQLLAAMGDLPDEQREALLRRLDDVEAR